MPSVAQCEIIKCYANPSRCCLRREPPAPIGLGKAEAQVDPTVFLRHEQSRIPNRKAQVTIQDDPLAEAMFGLVLPIVGEPLGVKRITIGAPNHANAASTSSDSNGRRTNRRVSIKVRPGSLSGLLMRPRHCAPDLRRLPW
jgi:hypothetical protein